MSDRIALTRWYACQAVDEAAGEVRLDYITEVPGQQAVYVMKLQQARAYLSAIEADADSPVPPYIVIEARRLGVSASAAAAAINEIGTLWNDTLSPLIEEARLTGKDWITAAAGADAASTVVAIEAAKSAALEALNAYKKAPDADGAQH